MSSPGAAFAAVRHADFRPYVATALLAMMGDNVEHVISYWVIYQAFHSPTLAGFAVIAHWLPFLLFGVHFGALADRHDRRRLIQIAQLMFAAASLAWAFLFLAGTLQVWHAVVILLVHGVAGAIFSPAGQLLVQDMVGDDDLQSGIRTTATARQIGILLGPAVGGTLLVVVGPAYGLMINALVYLPLTVWLQRAPCTGRGRAAAVAQRPLAITEALRTLRSVRHHRGILVMTALAGLSSLFVGAAYQAQMPEFASGLVSGSTALAYSVLLASSAAGAVVGGFALEASPLFRRPSERTAVVLAMGWSLAILAFAFASVYALAVAALFVGGLLSLAFTSMAQSLVQLEAPPAQRGRVVGLFSTSWSGLRVGSGVTVGILGGVIGIHASLALSCVAFFAVALALLAYASGRARRLAAA